MLFYVNFLGNKKKHFLAVSYILFIFSLLSKPSAVTFILFIPILDYVILKKLTFNSLYRFLCFLIPSAIITIVLFQTRQDAGTAVFFHAEELSFFKNLGYAIWSPIIYLKNVLFISSPNPYQLYPKFHIFMYAVPLIMLIVLVFILKLSKKFGNILFLSLSFSSFLFPFI
jgi:hypothetical protein